MPRALILVVGLPLAACSSVSTWGPGDHAGTGGTGGNDGGTSSCASECCPKAPYPCAGLDEAACGARSDCTPVKGAPFGADGGAAVYIGCSSCQLVGAYETCVVDPAHPNACYAVQGNAWVPDGWQEVFECSGCAPDEG